MYRLVIIFSLFSAAPLAAQEIAVPSGVPMTLYDVLLEQDPTVARFRFVAPAIAGGAIAFADVIGDLEYLCSAVAIPGLAANGWTTGDIVISLSAEEVPFGEMSPDITQYFQPFSIQDDTCIWEDF